MKISKWIAVFALTLGLAWLGFAQDPPTADEEIDFNKARMLLQKFRDGQKLTAEEQEYLDRAKAARQKGNRGSQAEPKPSLGLVPLPDMTADATYKGQSGGLYGEGRNEPPDAHLKAALQQAEMIQPLDAEGNPAPDGKIVLISVGMSNTTQEFSAFQPLANADPDKAANVIIVDGAQGGREVADWADPENRFRPERPDPWTVLEGRLRQSGVTSEQVQVAWIKQARRNPATLGDFPEHTDEFSGHMVTLLQRLKETFPNLRIAYLSSRIYAGYASSPLNPEPYAYEYGFAVRDLIVRQIDGDDALNYDPAKDAVKAPLLLWGPYLWADGVEGRMGDDLVWNREDFAADGTHPGPTGRRKVAQLLLDFFKSNATAKRWFLKE